MLVRSGRRRAPAVAVHLVLALLALAFAAPLLWLFTASLDASAGARASVPRLTGAHFTAVLSWRSGGRPLWNGLLLCGGATALTVVSATLCAYPLSRYQLRFRRPLLYTLLLATGLPLTAIMVPVYGLFVRLDLIDSRVGTTVFLSATALPFAIWMTKNYLDGVPLELEEAAWTDGATPTRALRSVVLPLMAPGVAVVSTFVFVSLWGNFFVPFVLLLDPAKQPAAVGVLSYFGQRGMAAYGQLAAYSLVYTTPVVLLYLLVSRALGAGFSFAGAMRA
ncbi:carbohydrate ABC transporter permease [Streptoalloteichus hindustanus]|uniref:Carbohydrate ABC transporter membrane protein 2, CUT1 family n=1 Tax=Streptoalloteichus hindustanus TaxID=2017 RepID=A0A1M4UIG9_STRHI|nr:carbohydrate ABC transporter permease [Streptoalloteichus hindustanus]SHE56551.1 carbohydrate ABC transporter membrane protein 2, CUT1 family [Streptoalloteichus hindustanus]